MKVVKFNNYMKESFQLKTKKGSVIKRSGDVGKRMGGYLYLHKQYVDYIDIDLYNEFKDKLPEDFNYNILKYNKKENYISFILSPDFNTVDEPTVGDAYKVTKNKVTLTKQKNPPQIYHHKWLFVDDNYKGFNVERAKLRSKKWLEVSDQINMSKIGNKKYWDEEVTPLFEGLWDVDYQEYTSSKTSTNQIPRIFKEIIKHELYEEGDICLDIGGGKFDIATEFFAQYGITNYIFDPYNRTKEHNEYVISQTRYGQSDFVTVLNVLNVIQEKENQLKILEQAKDAVKNDGWVYIFSNYKKYREEARPIKNRDSYQHYDKLLKDYLPLIQEILSEAYIDKKIRCIVWQKSIW